jgi:hypothetical protein
LAGCNSSAGSGLCAAGSFSTIGNIIIFCVCFSHHFDFLFDIFFLFVSGSWVCENCKDGSISAMQGLSSCLDCAQGMIDDENHTKCKVLCSAGKFFDSTLNLCQLCPPGTFSTGGTIAKECIPCSKGSIAMLPGSTACTTCSSGTTSSVDGVSCLPCSLPEGSNESRIGCPACSEPSFVYQEFCINPFYFKQPVHAINISLLFPSSNVSNIGRLVQKPLFTQ